MQTILHPLAPIYNAQSKILILGTMPSPKSREAGFYYAHPQNRFWPILSTLLCRPLPSTNEERTQLCLSHH
ncbi:MAG: uracil-DNA glycosylase family protein, partial [Christensenellales bacterium]